ncbi:hypothetical protein IFR05_012726 [Cadophora sp. M221]|nr:hypothetical protein IFR05_012726 [Cadophora sp. M221]
MRTDNALKAGSVFPPGPAKQGRFDRYQRELHKNLARHEFERTFQLNEDQDRPDQLTTWIEYLGFEYVAYDQYAKIMKRLQKQYDEAWKKLVDAKVLKPSETKESLWIFGIKVQMKHEKSEAIKALESVTSAVQSAEKILLEAQSSGQSEQGLSQLERKLSTAKSKIATVTKTLQWASRRRKLISGYHNETRDYKNASNDASRQSILL